MWISSGKVVMVFLVFVLVSANSSAEGFLPETSIVFLDEVNGGGAILVKNTENKPLLLYSKIINLPEDGDEGALAILTPPVARVEAKEQQQVRFMLQLKQPLRTQRLKRVIFEGIPQKLEEGKAQISLAVRQNLPLVIHPKGLPVNREPWKLLKWSFHAGKLMMENDSPYVVRMAEVVHLQPQGTAVQLEHNYVLPGQRLSFSVAESRAEAVRLYPATLYGFSVEGYDAPLTAKAD